MAHIPSLLLLYVLFAALQYMVIMTIEIQMIIHIFYNRDTDSSTARHPYNMFYNIAQYNITDHYI